MVEWRTGEGVGGQHEGREKNQPGEERDVSMPLLRPISAKRLPCMSQRSVGTLEHTASKYVHLALTFFLGVTGFEGIRDIFLRLRPKLSGQIANLKFKHEIRGRNFPQLNPVLLPSISSICSALIYSQSVSALMSPRSIVSPAAKTFPDQSG